MVHSDSGDALMDEMIMRLQAELQQVALAAAREIVKRELERRSATVGAATASARSSPAAARPRTSIPATGTIGPTVRPSARTGRAAMPKGAAAAGPRGGALAVGTRGAAPAVATIEGMLQGPPGIASLPRPSLVVHLAPWQRVTGSNAAIELDAVRLDVEMNGSELEGETAKWSNGSTIQVSLVQLRRSPHNRYRIWLGKGRIPVRSVRATAALRAARAELDRPVEVEDDTLGRVVLDRVHNRFQGIRRIGGSDCKIDVMRSTPSHAATHDLRDIERAARVIARLETRLPRLRDAIARGMLKEYNHGWCERGLQLTKEEFLARINPMSVIVNTDGSAAVYFANGGLFADHPIKVLLGLRGGIDAIYVGSVLD